MPQNISYDCRLFADVLLYDIRENYKILQNDLNELEELGKLRQLAFNNSKYSVLSIHNNTLQQLYNLNNSTLRNVLNHPCLLIELSYDSKKWEKHITNITAKASSLKNGRHTVKATGL